MSELMVLGKAGLASQPFSKLLGVELIQLTAGNAEFKLAIRNELKQQNGFVHGGVIGTLADNGLAFVAGTALGINIVTSEYKINFVRPATGEYLLARSSVLSSGSKQAVCDCKVFSVSDGLETLVAIAQGTISKGS
jgi:uncharacterized protein (TIGR00369 family)